ncbi:MAG TPA: crotonase/enoyl-CoA hydratase family protein, partial [Ilumatobacteraceae bacterium]|nr:crotonase/enoyl-CoA hydratase family protein [Ilumatobacteraceae bacterium]
MDDINAALDEVESDESIGAVVLHGRPGRFSAGFDLTVVNGGDMKAIIGIMVKGASMFRRLYGLPVPVVSACTGHAVAGGAFVLLASDYRVGADLPCKIGLNEVAIGLVLPAWAITFCHERLSKRHAQRSVMLAELTGPVGAVDAGFLDEVQPEGEVLARAVAKAGEYAQFSRAAYHGNVKAMRGATLAALDAQIAKDRALL